MPTSNSDDGDASLSLPALEQLARDTDPEIVPELIAVFLDDARQRISRISDAIESADYQVMAAEAHALGSSAATFGLPGIHTIARRCEHSLREGHPSEGAKCAGELIANTTLGLEALGHYAQGLQ